MMQNINRVVVTGNLVRDPELRQAGDTTVCALRIAVNSRRKVAGEWQDVPGFYDVTVFGKQGESVARYMAKGRPIAVDGRLDFREWQDKDGNKRQAVQIVADSVQFLGERGSEQQTQQAPAQPSAFERPAISVPSEFSKPADDEPPF